MYLAKNLLLLPQLNLQRCNFKQKTVLYISLKNSWHKGGFFVIFLLRAYSIAVTRVHGMDESGVRLPVGPPLRFAPQNLAVQAQS